MEITVQMPIRVRINWFWYRVVRTALGFTKEKRWVEKDKYGEYPENAKKNREFQKFRNAWKLAILYEKAQISHQNSLMHETRKKGTRT